MSAEDWLPRLGRLRVDRDTGRGRAPHKPLLLLAVLELLEAGGARDGWITRSPELVVRFENLWPIVEPRRRNRGDLRLPFHHLSSDGIWRVFDEEGRPSKARETSLRARLPDDLALALGDPAFRARARRILITTYFPPEEQVALGAALGCEADAADAGAQASGEHAAAAYVQARQTGRSARLKTEVVVGYHFTCALTGYRLTTVEQIGIVEAAHIHPHAESCNDAPTNGLALTPTAHRLFDLGLWSVATDLTILVKPPACFSESAPGGGFSLRALAGRPLCVPAAATLRPGPEHLRWHRARHGF